MAACGNLYHSICTVGGTGFLFIVCIEDTQVQFESSLEGNLRSSGDWRKRNGAPVTFNDFYTCLWCLHQHFSSFIISSVFEFQWWISKLAHKRNPFFHYMSVGGKHSEAKCDSCLSSVEPEKPQQLLRSVCHLTDKALLISHLVGSNERQSNC